MGKTLLVDKGQVIGAVVTTRQGANPFTWVSVIWPLFKQPSILCCITSKAAFQNH